MEGNYYWITYVDPAGGRFSGLYLVDFDYNSLGDILLRSVELSPKVIPRKWVVDFSIVEVPDIYKK